MRHKLRFVRLQQPSDLVNNIQKEKLDHTSRRTSRIVGAMEVPLNVVRDSQGIFRDAHDQPMIVVFSSKPRRPRKRDRICSGKGKDTDSRPFTFVHVGKPGEEDAKTKRLIRTHVMRNVPPRAPKKPEGNLESTPKTSSTNLAGKTVRATLKSTSSLLLPQPSLTMSFPIQIRPYMRVLIYQCG